MRFTRWRILGIGTALLIVALSTGGGDRVSAVSPPTPYKIVYVASQGYTPEAASLMPSMLAEASNMVVHGGDLDFSDAAVIGCQNFPGLPFMCGPSVLGESEVRARWWNMVRPLFAGRPVYVSWGNHESGKRSTQQYFLDLFVLPGNERYYSVDVSLANGLAHLIFLNDNERLDPGAPQRIWLEANLQANWAAMWKVVFVHGAPYSWTKPSLPLRQLSPLFDQRYVDLIVSGHVLWYERTNQYVADASGVDGIRVVDNRLTGYLKHAGRIAVNQGAGGMRAMGTAYNPLVLPRQIRPYVANYLAATYSYLTLEWSADGRVLTVQAIDATGRVRDEFTISQ